MIRPGLITPSQADEFNAFMAETRAALISNATPPLRTIKTPGGTILQIDLSRGGGFWARLTSVGVISGSGLHSGSASGQDSGSCSGSGSGTCPPDGCDVPYGWWMQDDSGKCLVDMPGGPTSDDCRMPAYEVNGIATPMKRLDGGPVIVWMVPSKNGLYCHFAAPCVPDPCNFVDIPTAICFGTRTSGSGSSSVSQSTGAGGG